MDFRLNRDVFINACICRNFEKYTLLNLNTEYVLHFNISMLLSRLKQNNKSIFNMRIGAICYNKSKQRYKFTKKNVHLTFSYIRVYLYIVETFRIFLYIDYNTIIHFTIKWALLHMEHFSHKK